MKRTGTNRMVLGAAIASFAIAAAVAVVTTNGHGASDTRIHYARAQSLQPRVRTTSPSEAVAAIMARYGGHRVVAAGVGNPPAVKGAQQGTYLHFVVAASNDESANRAEWEADLVQGAAADSLALSGATPVVGSSIDLKLPDGTILPHVGGGMGDVAPGQAFEAPSDATLIAQLNQELRTANLSPISIQVLHADQPAPAVVATTNDPAGASAAAVSTINSLFGQDPPKYEGFYFEVQNTAGQPIFIQSAAFRTGAGRQWVDAKFADVTSLQHL